jgi:hypothetical protein
VGNRVAPENNVAGLDFVTRASWDEWGLRVVVFRIACFWRSFVQSRCSLAFMLLQCDVSGSVRVLPLHVVQLAGHFIFPGLK